MNQENKENSRLNTSSLFGFIPAIVVQHLIENKQKGIQPNLPEKQSFRSLVMFADISGFTNLTEQLSKIGPEGSEVIAFAINRYMELLVKSISKSGGDIFKFAGDAMIVVWPPSQIGNQEQKEESLRIMIRQGIQSALDIQAKLNDTFILENIKLSVKIGFGVGDISIIYVGGVFNRSEFLATGDPLIQAFSSEHCAKQGGETIISKEVFIMVEEYFNFIPITDHNGFYYVISGKGNKVQNISNALMIKNNITATQIEHIKNDLLRYIPAALQQFIQVDQEKWSSEIRRITIMFVNLGIDLSDAQTDKGLQQIQKVIQTVQKCVYAFQGSLNKLLMDDKGSTLIVVFGLLPMSKQDDPSRAIMTALTMKEELAKINCRSKFGIGTGCVFTGVVGTSGSRREYSVIGDSVNLSARLMQAACGDTKQSIILDEETAKEASQKLRVSFYKTIEVKGKTQKIATYIPDSDQRNHFGIHNPNYPHKNYPEHNKTLIQSIITKINQFIQNPKKQLIKIKGSYGVGKTQLINVCLTQIQQQKQKKQDQNLNIIKIRLNYFMQLDQLTFYSIRTICQQLLAIQALKQNVEPDLSFLSSIVPQQDENNEQYQKFIKLFEFTKISQIQIFESHYQEDYSDIQELKILILRLIAIVLQETPKKLEDLFKSNQSITQFPNNQLIIVIDDAHNIDKFSYKILRSILKHFNKVMLILLMRDDYFENGSQLNQKVQQIEQINDGLFFIESVLEDDNIMDVIIPKLQKYELQQLFEKQFSITKFRVDNTVKLTQYVKQNSQQLQADIFQYDLTKYSLIHNNTTEFFIQAIYLKCKGNPLTLINFMNILLKNNFLLKSMDNPQIAIITSKLLNIILLEESVEAPLDRIRINYPIIDKLGCLELLILKVGSVIGDIFDIQMLDHIQPFKENIPSDRLLQLLDNLENEDIIEVMEINNLNKYYRFCNPFMREIIYSRLIYAQRRDLHKKVAQTIQEIPSQFILDEKLEAKRLEFHWMLAEQKWSTVNNELSHKAKRSIIIKSIQNKIQHNIGINLEIKIGILEKKSDKNISWAPRFCVMTTKELKYFYNEIDYHQGTQPLGLIPLNYIYLIVPLNEKEKGNKNYAFEIKVSNWQKKQKTMPRREFYFAALDEEQLEEWTIYLEFMKAKAIYDEFVSNFGKIQFPIATFKDFYNLRLSFEISNKTALQRNIRVNQNEQKLLKRTRKNTQISINSRVIRSGSSENLFIADQDKTKERLIIFINRSLLILFSHIFEASIKIKNRQNFIDLGCNTKTMAVFVNKFQIDQSLIIGGQSPISNLSQKISLQKKRFSDSLFVESPIKLRGSFLEKIKEEEADHKDASSMKNSMKKNSLTIPIPVPEQNHRSKSSNTHQSQVSQSSHKTETNKKNNSGDIPESDTTKRSLIVSQEKLIHQPQLSINKKKSSIEFSYEYSEEASDQIITNLKFESKNNRLKQTQTIKKQLSIFYGMVLKDTQSISLPKQFLKKGMKVKIIQQNLKNQTEVQINGVNAIFVSSDFLISN